MKVAAKNYDLLQLRRRKFSEREREREGKWRKEGAYNDSRRGGTDNNSRNEGKTGNRRDLRDPRYRQKTAERTDARREEHDVLNYGRRERASDGNVRKMDDKYSGWERTTPRERSRPSGLGSTREERPRKSFSPPERRSTSSTRYGDSSDRSGVAGRSEDRRRPTGSLSSRMNKIPSRGRPQDDEAHPERSNRFEDRTDRSRTDVTDSTKFEASSVTPEKIPGITTSSLSQPDAPPDVQQQSPPKRSRPHLPVITEFYPSPLAPHRAPSVFSDLTVEYKSPLQGYDQSTDQLPLHFTSPPLMPGLLSCLTDVLGPVATPTPIQGLSLKWILGASGEMAPRDASFGKWRQFLLASETGSGKSIAYLLPVLQALKQSELHPTPSPISRRIQRPRALNPRALILAPTHELSRQLSGFAKALLHEIKLRVLCASRANVKSTSSNSTGRYGGTASKMADKFGKEDMEMGEFQVMGPGKARPVDLVVGTPMKLLDMIRGRGWDRKEAGVEEPEDIDEDEDGWKRKHRRGSDLPTDVSARSKKGEPEMGLSNVEWVVVDEADVLFGEPRPC